MKLHTLRNLKVNVITVKRTLSFRETISIAAIEQYKVILKLQIRELKII